MDLQGDFHLPPCNRRNCNIRLEELAQALKKQDSKTVVVKQKNYPPYGIYEECFDKACHSCSFTVIHKCRGFLEQINSFKSILLDDTKKVMVISFKSKDKPKWLNDGRQFDFFNRWNISDASTDQSLKDFAAKAIHFLHQIHPRGDDDNPSLDQVENEDEFVRFPDLFSTSKPTDIFVLRSKLKISDKSALESCIHIEKCADLSKEMKRNAPLPNVKCLFFKVLPTMYSNKDIVSLALLAVCDHPRVSASATFMLQLALLKSQTENSLQQINQLMVAESLLWWQVLYKRQGTADVGINTAHYLRLVITYVMILCDFTLTCISSGRYAICDTHFDTIDGRSLPSTVPTDEESVKKTFSWFNIFLTNLIKRKCKFYKNNLLDLEDIEDDIDEKKMAELVAREPAALQAIFAYQALKEVFKSVTGQHHHHLGLLKEFVLHKVPKPDNMEVEAATALTLQGLTLFVVFELKRTTVGNVQNFCRQVMDVLKLRFAPYTAKKERGKTMDNLLQMLFFNANPYIRGTTMSTTVMKETNLFTQLDKTLMLNEAKRLLCPLLTDGKIEPMEIKSGARWLLYKGKFDDSDVAMRLHIPYCEHLQDKLKTSFTDEDSYYTEMITLEKLQHKNIVKMVAFQKLFVPQFYILEAYPNLQEVLKNKTENQDYELKATLVRYLTQALTAVEFCHSSGFVHRNLTAQSLLLVQDDHVKLSGFHLCLKMTDGEATGKASTNDMILTRWSAPESLRDNKYSSASDVWMFGHLMYEVLTHGCLPYYDMRPEELAIKIIEGKVSLSEQQKFISDGHYGLITQCANTEPEGRPTLSSLKNALDQKDKADRPLHEQERVEFDDFADGHKPSTLHEKGVPLTINPKSEMDSSEVLELQDISDTITKITEETRYIFKEKLTNMSSEVTIRLRKGALDDLFPYIRIKESTKEMPHSECSFPRLSSQSVEQEKEGSLVDVALEKKLGEGVAPYLRCLHQAAQVLEKLHARSWVLGHLSTSLLYIQWQEQGPKVHVISVSYLQYKESGSNFEGPQLANISAPLDSLLLARSAPEVARFGTFSPRSDIYCFGNLMWETMMALSCPGHMKSEFSRRQAELASMDQEEILDTLFSERWEVTHEKPEDCPDKLYEIMQNCTQLNSTTRIAAERLVYDLERLLQTL